MLEHSEACLRRRSSETSTGMKRNTEGVNGEGCKVRGGGDRETACPLESLLPTSCCLMTPRASTTSSDWGPACQEEGKRGGGNHDDEGRLRVRPPLGDIAAAAELLPPYSFATADQVPSRGCRTCFARCEHGASNRPPQVRRRGHQGLSMEGPPCSKIRPAYTIVSYEIALNR